jgi:NitT/TauT family transport system substrate-binding protein
LVDGLAATNYEYNQIKHSVVPVILLDKSYGGDKVLSDRNITELKKAKKIDVYLEIDSVNSVLLKGFIKKYHIPKSKLVIHNKDQQEIIKSTYDFKKPIIIVTYAPYDATLKKMGFKEIASTKTDKDLLVIDALFINKKLYSKKRFKILKKDIDKAIEEIKKDPQKAYQLIKQYYTNYSFEDFKKDLNNIKWINNPSKELILQLQRIGFETKDLVNEN